MSNYLLEVKNLKTSFYTEDGEFAAVDGVDFAMERGEILGIVGESGCGKSVMSLSILRLLSDRNCRIVDGEVLYEGEDLLGKTEDEMCGIRGNKISMIFQEPMTSLNPVFSVGSQVSEVYRAHCGMAKNEAQKAAVEMLRIVGIPSPDRRAKDYPHQMSGGMRQRVMIAMALACRPALLIADEPTTALDVTMQAQILQQIRELQKQMNMSVMLITHDMGVVAEMAKRIMVMYAGQVVEIASKQDIFKQTKHPYTEGLLSSIPRLNSNYNVRLETIEGVVPGYSNMPTGCLFHPRCKDCRPICKEKRPPLFDVKENHKARCWKYMGQWV